MACLFFRTPTCLALRLGIPVRPKDVSDVSNRTTGRGSHGDKTRLYHARCVSVADLCSDMSCLLKGTPGRDRDRLPSRVRAVPPPVPRLRANGKVRSPSLSLSSTLTVRIVPRRRQSSFSCQPSLILNRDHRPHNHPHFSRFFTCLFSA